MKVDHSWIKSSKFRQIFHVQLPQEPSLHVSHINNTSSNNNNSMRKQKHTFNDEQKELLAKGMMKFGKRGHHTIRDEYFEGMTSKSIYDKIRSDSFRKYLERRCSDEFVGGMNH